MHCVLWESMCAAVQKRLLWMRIRFWKRREPKSLSRKRRMKRQRPRKCGNALRRMNEELQPDKYRWRRKKRKKPAKRQNLEESSRQWMSIRFYFWQTVRNRLTHIFSQTSTRIRPFAWNRKMAKCYASEWPASPFLCAKKGKKNMQKQYRIQPAVITSFMLQMIESLWSILSITRIEAPDGSV